MFNLDQIVTITFTLFAVIDVIGSIPVIISVKNKIGKLESGKTTLVSGGLMVLFFFFGNRILKVLGLDVHSFAVAGSIVIFLIAMEMILGLEFFKSDPDVKSGSVFPIAFPVISGSGTLTTIMSLKADFDAYNILVGILINIGFIYLVLLSTDRIERFLGKAGLVVIRKFFGLILLAIAVKIFKSNISVL